MTSPGAVNSQAAQQRRERGDEFTAAERRRDRRRTAMGVVALVMLSALVVMVARGQNDKNKAVDNATNLAEQVDAACQAGGQAATELAARGACGQARKITQDPIRAAPLVAELPDEQVRRLVAEYLKDNPPAPGAAGRIPTSSEVDAAVQRVCERLNCQGPPGTNGEAGQDGTDGESGQNGADGADAPPVTDDQVRAVVQGYCDANNGCRPTATELQAAVDAYCAQAGEPCRGAPGQPATLPDQYRRIDQDPLLGEVTWMCARTTPPEQLPPTYSCAQETP